MTFVTSEAGRSTYELPIEGIIDELTGTYVRILAHQIKLIELTWLRVRQFEAVGLVPDERNRQRMSAVVRSAGELAARYMSYPTT